MKVLNLAVGATLLLAGAGFGSASASPGLPMHGVLAGGHPVTEVAYRHRHHTMHHHRIHRRHHIRNHRMHGHPNARNPSRPGHMQQFGNTSGGRHY